ncbi:MAG: GNAT family N-acetyltransferase [Alteromonadaceae bacterium]|nr:GNAT family N-acetyltransferase [Alteromonadaceae bacterium]
MFIVDPKNQIKGIGRGLLSSALSYASVGTVAVSAPFPSVSAYRKYSFKCKGDTAESADLLYQPMEIELNKKIESTVIASAD